MGNPCRPHPPAISIVPVAMRKRLHTFANYSDTKGHVDKSDLPARSHPTTIFHIIRDA